MLNHIEIKGFKCIDEQKIDFRPLTLISGPNSSGKSTLLQAVLLSLSASKQKNIALLRDVIKPYSVFEEVFNQYTRPDKIRLKLVYNNNAYLEFIQDRDNTDLSEEDLTKAEGYIFKNDNSAVDQKMHGLSYEENFFYLSANRIGPQETAELNREIRVGQNGQYTIGLYELEKDKIVAKPLLVEDADAKTLKAQIAWWLSMITGHKTSVESQKVTSTLVKLSYFIDELTQVSPLNTGAGNSYLFRILVMCLTAKPGDVLLIENPEIHLHPGAQARLGYLFAFLAQRGVQLIVETHCEHLINRIRYEIYKGNIDFDKTILYYKPSLSESFSEIRVNKGGHFTMADGHEIDFPAGFFDATLEELLEIS
ncbi:MAG: AAA family ATPase [Pusillimonas sp.]